MSLARFAVLAVLLGGAGPALAQQPERPREEDLFGGPRKDEKPEEKGEEKPAPPAEGKPDGVGGAEQARDEALMGGDPSAPTRLSETAAPDNPLTIGGQFYLRGQASALQGQEPDRWALSSPSLLDAYFDARPNDRVRGFVLARMQFDPTKAIGAAPMPVDPTAPQQSLVAPPARGPVVALDQMWLRFDLKRTVFVTAGRQHVRWGTGRFWTPTDFLHVQRRNPLDPFDARVGTTMLKLHLPWEAQGWNFYAYGVTDFPQGTPALGDVAGAGRAEIVIGTAEAGIGALVQRDRKPKVGADLSIGIWEFDLYGEIALRYGSEIDRVGFDQSADPLTMFQQRYPVFRESGLRPQVVGGFTYSLLYADKDVLTIGGEYFYNSLGYEDERVYPGLFPIPGVRDLAEAASPFYFGRHYGALFVLLPAPFSWDLTSFTLSTLGNLSDRSFITRLDYALTLLTHLRFEVFAAVHYGRRQGEFRFAVDLPPPLPSRAPAILDLGVALRVSL